MNHSICIFEDDQAENLYPLSLTRPVYDLRCGITTLKEKIVHQFPLTEINLHCRSYLQQVVAEQNPGIFVNNFDGDSCLFINGRWLADNKITGELDFSEECIYYAGDEVLAAFLKKEKIKKVDFSRPLNFPKEQFNNIEEKHVEANLIRYPWELVNHNIGQIIADFKLLGQGGELSGELYESVVLVKKQNIHIGANSKIKPGVVIDAESGPVYISNNVTIMPNAVIEGPAFVGHSTIIKTGAKIYEGTSIGEVCKVGGEVEDSIIHSYSNKQHGGFLGHAYLGQWVNLGAYTNNSDLKNNYGSVKVHINGQMVDSGSTFVGLFMGDHSKAGINTMFNTGTTVGVMTNVFGAGFPPKHIPSFRWGGSTGVVEHDLEKAIATAKKAMARRKMKMSKAQEDVFRRIKKE